MTTYPPANLESFMNRVAKDPVSGCWIWIGYVGSRGYGQIIVGSRSTRRITRRAHRVAYELFVGPVPDGRQLDHLCHTEAARLGQCDGGTSCPHRACVNPEHLEAVTPEENTARGSRAAKTYCAHGHEYTPENTRWANERSGPVRHCRTCARLRRRAERAAARQLEMTT